MNTSLLLLLILSCFAACSFVMMAVWAWSYRIKNAGVVDIFWSLNFPLIALLLYFLADGHGPRKLLITGMVLVWGLRLGIYLLVRVGSHLSEEEGRYKQLRQEWAPHAEAKFFGFFQMQAFSNVFLSIPFFLICLNRNSEISLLEYAAASLWLISLIGEATADAQLRAFKKDPASKGKVCNKGLWNYSRHPNYFFEWMIWMAYFLFACASPWGWVSVICPASILFLILKVTGIPLTEEQSIRSKGDAYREYQRTTSAFVPWKRKN
jgi:steroid 5-alpha reductase family enzyme